MVHENSEISPVARQLLQYWKSRRGDREMPGRADLDPLDMGPFLSQVFLVDVSHEPLDFSYRLIGTEIVDRSVHDYTGKRLADLPSQRKPSDIWSLFETAAIQRRPVRGLVPQLKYTSRFVEMQALPLSRNGEQVEMLIGTVVFDPVPASALREPAI